MKTSDNPNEVHSYTQRDFPLHRVCEYCKPGKETHGYWDFIAAASFVKTSHMKAGGVKVSYKNYACSDCAIRLKWISIVENTVETKVDMHEISDIYSEKLKSDPFWNPD